MASQSFISGEDAREDARDGRQILLRKVEPRDTSFLRDVYAGVRIDELALTDWSQAEKESFINMQFEAQSQYYREVYGGEDYFVVLEGNKPVGRLYLHRMAGEIRIVDLAILPAFRNRGIGTYLLNDILIQATREGVSVSIHVERMNPALHLYVRLGFTLFEDKGVYLFLRWSPRGLRG